MKILYIGVLLSVAFIFCRTTASQTPVPSARQEQPVEVVEAYAICKEFQHLLAQDLDFSQAYESTFVKDVDRRRAIAISDGSLGDQKFEDLDSDLLIKAYKLQMQLLYLLVPLVDPTDAEAKVFFPPEIELILKRQPAVGKTEFENYVVQLEKDVARFRAHLNRLAEQYPSVAERVSSFKADAMSGKFEPPADHKIQPLNGYFGLGQLRKNEPYYEIESYRVVNEDGKMRIVGLRFFTRLF